MIALPRPLVRNSLFILVTIVVIVCIQDRVFTVLEIVNDLNRHRLRETDHQPLTNEGNTTKRELVLLQMVFRHGHRAPFMLYPTDPNPESLWKEGLAMLTKLGKLQHYVMGLHLQNMYKDFITTNPNEVEMSNSDNYRCHLGVYAFMAGLYSPKKEYSFTDEIRWQPVISKHHQTSKGKFIFSHEKCNISDEDSLALKKTKEASDTRERYKDIYTFWSYNSGRLVDSWVLAADLGKTLTCELDYNYTVPEWGLKYWEEFRLQAAISYYFNFGTKLIQRYRIGPLLGYMIDKMDQKIFHKFDKRVIVYSAHGSNLALLMLALDNYNWVNPPHASTMVLELWKEENDDYSIRWLFFNSSNPERQIDPPFPILIPGCGEFCPINTFRDMTKRLIPDDWEAECQNQSMKDLFKPLEKTLSIPISSSSRVTFHWTAIASSLICIYITGKMK